MEPQLSSIDADSIDMLRNATQNTRAEHRDSDSPVGDQPGSGSGPVDLLTGLPSDEGASDAVQQVSAEVQTAVMVEAGVQYAAPSASAHELRCQAASAELAAFLHSTVPLCEEALQQNELVDVLSDELAVLAEEDGGEGPHGSAASRTTAAGLVEHHSFSDLLYSKDKVLVASEWHPSQRGVVAGAYILPTQQQDRGPRPAGGGQPALPPLSLKNAAADPSASGQALQLPPTGCILVWNHADAIHPEAVLQAPAEVLAFAFHPTQPQFVAAGLVTGQVALFNLQQQNAAGAIELAALTPSASTSSAGFSQQATQAAVPLADISVRDDGSRALLLPVHVSMPEASHQAGITDLQWMPGTQVSREGKLELVSATAGNAGAAASDACNLFATSAADGSLLLWDMRITTRHRRGATREDEPPDWKPVLTLAASSTAKQPLPASRFCLDARYSTGRFLLGSLGGELAIIDAPTFHIERKGNTEWCHNTVQQLVGHMGRVVALGLSPFMSDALLMVGDSGFVVWRLPSRPSASRGGGSTTEARASAGGIHEGSESGAKGGSCLPIFRSPYSGALYTCGCWSPTKPGIIIVGRLDGRLEVWDLLDRTHQPSIVAAVAPCALTSLSVSPQPAQPSRAAAPQALAVGDAAGTLHLLELPRALRRRGRTEAKTWAALLQHEEDRLAAVERRAAARLAEQRASAERERADAAAAQSASRKQKKEEEKVAASKDVKAAEEQSAEERYLAFEAEWRAKLLGSAAGATAVPA